MMKVNVNMTWILSNVSAFSASLTVEARPRAPCGFQQRLQDFPLKSVTACNVAESHLICAF